MTARQGYSAPALDKGLAIIELLAHAQKPLSMRAIADRLGRSKGEIFRMVFVLVERGYLLRDAATDQLTLSNRLFDLGMRTPRSRQLVEVAIPAMERLSDRIGHSSHLVVLNRGETVNALWLIVAAVCVYALAYRFYAAWIAAKAGPLPP